MTVATCTNPHGESTLDTADYEFVDYFDNDTSWAFLAATMPGFGFNVELFKQLVADVEAWRERLAAESTSVYRKVGQCAHCGTHIRYHVVYRHLPTGALLAIGQDCAQNRLNLSPRAWKARKEQLDRMREKARQGEKRIALREQYPDAVALLEECLKDAFDRDTAMDHDNPSARTAVADFRDRWPAFVYDIAVRMVQYNGLSDKQAAAVVKAVPEHRARIQQRRDERANAAPVPTGKQVIEGVVLSTKWQDSAYGGAMKMLVQGDGGWKVWGTVPASIDPTTGYQRPELKGARVRFKATVEASTDDPSFGFFKRPTQAERMDPDA